MYAAERHRSIVDEARATGRVEVAALAVRFAVTMETVRRDLTALEQQGLLRRVHGGAMPVEHFSFEPGVAARQQVRTAEKERIAKAALAEVPLSGAIVIDAGTTTAQLAQLLPGDLQMTVITNALPIAMLLSSRPNLDLLVVGGRVRGVTLAAVDQWAIDALESTHVDVAFMGTNGLSVRHGLTTPDLSEAAVKAAMVRAADRVVVLADATKVDHDCLARFATLSEVDVVITDIGLDDERAAAIVAAGPRLVRA